MELLDYFALAVLIVLCGVAVGLPVFLAYLPGHIARRRGHPQATAVSVCGWVGLFTMGLLLPLAYVWAYWRSEGPMEQQGQDP